MSLFLPRPQWISLSKTHCGGGGRPLKKLEVFPSRFYKARLTVDFCRAKLPAVFPMQRSLKFSNTGLTMNSPRQISLSNSLKQGSLWRFSERGTLCKVPDQCPLWRFSERSTICRVPDPCELWRFSQRGTLCSFQTCAHCGGS